MQIGYQFSYKSTCHHACDYCPEFGAKSEANLTSIDLDKRKEKVSHYHKVLVPCNFQQTQLDKDLIAGATVNDHQVIYQAQISDYIQQEFYNNKEVKYQLITDDYLKLISLEAYDLTHVESVLFIVKKSNYKSILKDWFKVLSKVRTKIKFKFLQTGVSKVKYLSCYQAYKFHKKLQKLDRTVEQSQFLSDVDIYEPKVAVDMELEATYQPLFVNKVLDSNILLSIVIPSYNNKNEVLQTVKYLNNQNLDKKSYEVVMVDDGSTDGTSQFIKENFYKFGYSLNFKLIHYPRVAPRVPGDKRFRAGLARNVGVKQTVGELLMFCDADIVFPKDSLEKIIAELTTNDVIQIQRHYLKEGVKVSQLNKPEFDVEKNSFHPNNGYWRDFYQQGETWMQMKAPWKYICTFGLALKKEDFLAVGRFRKVFLNYGFEDTDLGYRLFKQNKKFKLSSVKAYHQFGKFERNEYKHSSMKRHNLLSTTAKIFYRHYIDPDIFDELPSFLRV